MSEMLWRKCYKLYVNLSSVSAAYDDTRVSWWRMIVCVLSLCVEVQHWSQCLWTSKVNNTDVINNTRYMDGHTHALQDKWQRGHAQVSSKHTLSIVLVSCTHHVMFAACHTANTSIYLNWLTVKTSSKADSTARDFCLTACHWESTHPPPRFCPFVSFCFSSVTNNLKILAAFFAHFLPTYVHTHIRLRYV